MLGVLGCLDNERGLAICKEMMRWLTKEHIVFVAHQSPPGALYEYPALWCVIDMAIRMGKPVLYIHTKGAGNAIPVAYKNTMMGSNVCVPSGATPEDCQRIVRSMWKHEFTGHRMQLYLDAVNTSRPAVACPFTGKEKMTWQNGFVINPAGAEELRKTFHQDANRYYYESMFTHIDSIKVVGIISEKCDLSEPNHTTMWNLMWNYYEPNASMV